jgi:hypothetical protein
LGFFPRHRIALFVGLCAQVAAFGCADSDPPTSPFAPELPAAASEVEAAPVSMPPPLVVVASEPVELAPSMEPEPNPVKRAEELLARPDAVNADSASEVPDELRYGVRYSAKLRPESGLAEVTIRIRQRNALVRSIRLHVDPERHFDFSADGPLELADRLYWLVPEEGGELRYSVRLDEARGAAGYVARSSEDWAIFRGEQVFPPMASAALPGAESDATLRIKTPKGWRVAAPFPELKPGHFVIEQGHRQLDQPRGWIVAGKLQVGRAALGGTEVIVAVPEQYDYHPASVLAFLRPTAGPLRDLFGVLPERMLIVSAGDPMWRGGLSGPNSLYIHKDRPLIQRDGTSPLLHELVHVASHAHSGSDGDWIVEGLAEYYSIELLTRSALINEAQRETLLHALRKRGESVDPATLLPGESRGARTARAVTILHELDSAIRTRSAGSASLDDVLRELATTRTRVTVESFLSVTEEATGQAMEGFLRDRIGDTKTVAAL